MLTADRRCVSRITLLEHSLSPFHLASLLAFQEFKSLFFRNSIRDVTEGGTLYEFLWCEIADWRTLSGVAKCKS